MPPLTTVFQQRIPENFPYNHYLNATERHSWMVAQETTPAATGDVLTGCCKACGDVISIHPTSPGRRPSLPSSFDTIHKLREGGLVQDYWRTTTSAPHEFLSPSFYIPCQTGFFFAGNHSGTATPTGWDTFSATANGTVSGAVTGSYSLSLTGSGTPSSGSYSGTISGALSGTFSGTFPATTNPNAVQTEFVISSPTLPGGSEVIGSGTVSGFNFTGGIRLVQRCYGNITWTSCDRGGMVLEIFRLADDALLWRYVNQHHAVRSMADAMLLLDYHSCDSCFRTFTQALCALPYPFTDFPDVPPP